MLLISGLIEVNEMSTKKLHPNVIKFKEFVKQYPEMAINVKKGVVSWQELYEDWYLLGEEDPRWDAFKGGDNHSNASEKRAKTEKIDLVNQVYDYLKSMDINQMQSYIYNISQAIGAVQGVLSQFQTPTETGRSDQSASKPSHPFTFRKD
jgi:hypothetical protein